MGMNVASVQPIEHNFWDSVVEVNSNLDWLHGNSDVFSGWGHHPGGLGSSDGGFVSDWEGMQDCDSKFLTSFDDFLG